jgi:hypothetical protein
MKEQKKADREGRGDEGSIGNDEWKKGRLERRPRDEGRQEDDASKEGG